MSNSPNRNVQVLRIFRKIHRTTGAFLFLAFLFVSLTGLLLGWKKHSGDLLLAESRQGTSTNLADWLPIDSLHQNAQRFLRDSVSTDLSPDIDRVDVRPSKGIVKFTFSDHYTGLQLDGATGALLYIEERRSDLVENIHDGSILDRWFGTSNGQIKLIYTTTTGLALLLFTVTGFWLWLGPKRLKKQKQKRRNSAAKDA